MIRKKVKVFWPMDQSWYVGEVMNFNAVTGEHELQYEDGDTEWVKIGDIMNAAAGMIANANNSTPSLGERAPGQHDSMNVPVSHGQRQIPPPMHHRPTPHNPDHHRLEEEVPVHDYRTGNVPGQVPYGYGAPYGPPVAGNQYQGLSGLSSGAVLPSYNPNVHAAGPVSQQGAIPQPQHHPNMPPPAHSYGIYPSSASPYSGAPMYPPHASVTGTSQYGVPPSAMSGMTSSYYGSANGATSPSYAKDDDDDNNNNDGGRRKTGPKPWTKEEDTLLLNLVHTMQWPMKWTIVAQSLPDRTGKQCRERYVNHLNPRLKASDWNPVEDSTIFHLYNTIGSHWAKMSKIIPGRTDNGIKNRFHNIRRQYEREDAHRLRLSSVEDFPEEIRLDRLRKFPEHLEGKSTQLWNMKDAIGVLAAQSVLGGNNSSSSALSRNGGAGGSIARFGPFRKPNEDSIELCVRCGLIVPSVHTGMEICTKTGWCQSCTRIPPNVSGNLLRECLNLRRVDNLELRKVIEAFEEFFVPSEANAWPVKKTMRSVAKKEEEEKVKD
jgi:Myb-like DNA-binding domain